MVFRKTFFRIGMWNSRPPPLHGKKHLKILFWLLDYLPEESSENVLLIYWNWYIFSKWKMNFREVSPSQAARRASLGSCQIGDWLPNIDEVYNIKLLILLCAVCVFQEEASGNLYNCTCQDHVIVQWLEYFRPTYITEQQLEQLKQLMQVQLDC